MGMMLAGCTDKAASKRVQSQVGLGFAEREQTRTQFKNQTKTEESMTTITVR